MKAQAVIPSKRNHKVVIPHDIELYKQRIASSDASIFRRFATRYDRRTIRFTGFVHLAATMIWLR